MMPEAYDAFSVHREWLVAVHQTLCSAYPEDPGEAHQPGGRWWSLGVKIKPRCDHTWCAGALDVLNRVVGVWWDYRRVPNA